MTRALVWLTTAVALIIVWFGYSRLSSSPPGPGAKKQTEAKRDSSEREFPEGLSEEALPRLLKWLQADGSRATLLPSRDIFRKGAFEEGRKDDVGPEQGDRVAAY